MSNNKENKNILDIKQVEELTAKIEKARAENTIATKAFEGNAKLAIKELKETKKIIGTAAEQLNAPISLARQNIEKLDFIANTFAIVPDKIDDRLAEFPKNFNESIANSIPDLSEELCEHIDTTFNSSVESFKIYTEEIMRNTNSQMDEALQKLRGGTDQLHFDMRHELRVYTEALDNIIDRSNRFRIRRLFYTLLLSGAFSAVVSALTVWHMITYGIWLK